MKILSQDSRSPGRDLKLGPPECRSANHSTSTFGVALGGPVVSVLATGPKVRGFKPGRGRWILRVIKSVVRLPSEGK
jgi:hypothetical protein